MSRADLADVEAYAKGEYLADWLAGPRDAGGRRAQERPRRRADGPAGGGRAALLRRSRQGRLPARARPATRAQARLLRRDADGGGHRRRTGPRRKIRSCRVSCRPSPARSPTLYRDQARLEGRRPLRDAELDGLAQLELGPVLEPARSARRTRPDAGARPGLSRARRAWADRRAGALFRLRAGAGAPAAVRPSRAAEVSRSIPAGTCSTCATSRARRSAMRRGG